MESSTHDDSGGPAADLEQLVEAKTRSARHLVGAGRWAAGGIAVAWSLFQLSLPTFVALNTIYVCCIHLGFALTLAFLLFPAVHRRKLRGVFSFLSTGPRLHPVTIAFAVVAAWAALYFLFQ